MRVNELTKKHERDSRAQQEGRHRVVHPSLGSGQAGGGKVELERRQMLPGGAVGRHLKSVSE